MCNGTIMGWDRRHTAKARVRELDLRTLYSQLAQDERLTSRGINGDDVRAVIGCLGRYMRDHTTAHCAMLFASIINSAGTMINGSRSWRTNQVVQSCHNAISPSPAP